MVEAGWTPAYGAALLLSAAALVRHRHDRERWRSSLAALGWTVASIATAWSVVATRLVILAVIDVALVVFLIALAWKARHAWPVLAAMSQAIGAAALIAGLVDGRLEASLPLTVASGATHATAGVLLLGAWIATPSRFAQDLANQANAFVHRLRLQPARLAEAPHRSRPGEIVLAATYDVHVQLRHDIAERADVQLVDGPAFRLGKPSHGGHGERDLLQQAPPFIAVEVVDLLGAGPARDQHEPWPARVVLQSRLAERQVVDERRRRLDPRVERPAHARFGTAAQ